MKTLQEYMLENINEGRLWDAIKSWFNSLFDNSKKEFDRANSEFDESEYTIYLSKHLDRKKIKLTNITFSDLKHLLNYDKVSNNTSEVSSQLSFSEFTSELSQYDKTKIFYAVTYEDDSVNDIVALFKCTKSKSVVDGYIEIEKLQVSTVFEKYFKVRNLITLFKSDTHIKEQNTGICVRRDHYTLYKDCIEQCNFVKKTDYCYIELNKPKKKKLNEDIDDNIFWKIDTYFQNNDNDLKAFNGLVDVCRANKGFNVNTIDAYVSGNELISKNQKKFIDFIEDNVQPDPLSNKDYSAALYNVVKTVIGNKSDGLKYTNNI